MTSQRLVTAVASATVANACCLGLRRRFGVALASLPSGGMVRDHGDVSGLRDAHQLSSVAAGGPRPPPAVERPRSLARGDPKDAHSIVCRLATEMAYVCCCVDEDAMSIWKPLRSTSIPQITALCIVTDDRAGLLASIASAVELTDAIRQ